MDQKISCRFFRVRNKRGTRIEFHAALQEIGALDIAGRERSVDDITMRLETLQEKAGYIAGDFVRVQSENFPALVFRGKRARALTLPDGGRLGHSAAFRYDPQMQVLLLQQNRNGITPRRLDSYIRAAIETDGYFLDPILREDAWERLTTIEPTKLRVRVADPDRLRAVNNSARGIRDGLRQLRQIAGGAYVEMSIGMGHERASLPQRIVREIIGSFRPDGVVAGNAREVGEVENISVLEVVGRAPDAVDEKRVVLDFIDAQLGASRDMTLPREYDDSYRQRAAFLTEIFKANIEVLQNQFGA